ncbi:hypothetical protein M5Y61_07840, partial [Neisseria meningitidis]|nr:hypothetical protein [Neisseria meningitidis]
MTGNLKQSEVVPFPVFDWQFKTVGFCPICWPSLYLLGRLNLKSSLSTFRPFFCCKVYDPIAFPKSILDGGGFAFEVQLSLTEKGQYAVAYGLSCKKDCHELHATDPRRTIP